MHRLLYVTYAAECLEEARIWVKFNDFHILDKSVLSVQKVCGYNVFLLQFCSTC